MVSKSLSVESMPDIRGGVVALGKFDALHVGHRALAEQAAKMGPPVLLSFTGMGAVLGWAPRLPVSALCDHQRIMSLWAERCGGSAPQEYFLEFIKVRSLSPRDFVQKLAEELQVKGVVAGVDYRFGYRAAGTVSDLVSLCKEYGLESFIVEPVMDRDDTASSISKELAGFSREKGQVSSTRIRKALEMGDIDHVTNLLGRKHRVVLTLESCTRESQKLRVPLSSALNQYPREGSYECALVEVDGSTGHSDDKIVTDDLVASTKLEIGPVSIDITLVDAEIELVLQRRLLGIEFSSR